jgi:hypothetical protein
MVKNAHFGEFGFGSYCSAFGIAMTEVAVPLREGGGNRRRATKGPLPLMEIECAAGLSLL